MRAASSLVVDIAGPKRRDSLTGTVLLADAAMADRSIVDGRIDLALTVEAADEDVVVQGTLSGAWRVPCRRCLDEVVAPLAVDFLEIFEYEPTEGETWPIADEHIDLTDPVRQAALLAIPLAPLCGAECRGPEPERFPTGAAPDPAGDGEPGGDPRWAALDALRTED